MGKNDWLLKNELTFCFLFTQWTELNAKLIKNEILVAGAFHKISILKHGPSLYRVGEKPCNGSCWFSNPSFSSIVSLQFYWNQIMALQENYRKARFKIKICNGTLQGFHPTCTIKGSNNFWHRLIWCYCNTYSLTRLSTATICHNWAI